MNCSKGCPAWLVVLLVVIRGALSANEAVLQVKKECAPGCTNRGNCNFETGQCECPWGYAGPACEVDRMSACRQTQDDPGSCGTLWPKSCECYQACQRLYCGGALQSSFCTHELGQFMWDAHCWVAKNPNTAFGSRLPENFASETTWYQHFPREGEAFSSSLELPGDRVGLSNWEGGHKVYPLEQCPNQCSNGRGVCFKWHHWDAPQCLCRKGYNGTSCEVEDDSEACWFSPTCGGRGRCRSGFCHCQPGFFGFGCHRTTAYRPATPGLLPDIRPRTKLKIYMYDLPWDIAFPYEYNDGHFGRDAMYKAYEYFMMYFLEDKAVRTENPYEANLFYVPMLLYFYIGNVRDPVPQATLVLDYVRKNWPFYNRTGGRDHFYFMTGDRGTCSIPRWMQDSCIKLVHFGMQRRGITWQGVPNSEYACVQVKRDLIVPPLNMFLELLPSGTEAHYQSVVANRGYDGNRTLLFFFAGGVGDGTEYSGGVRQAIKKLLSSLNPKPPDVEFVEGRASNYRDLLQTSKFCIAPYGYGWGLRLVQAIEYGCIPLIIQDNVYQPFEDFLPYEEFSVRMRLADVPHMVELLRTYTEDQLAKLRLGLAKYYRAFIWNREYSGMAYEWTLAGLERRLAHIQSEYFHHHHRRRE
ncbi:hypothetical protein Vafri_4706 [Volvox africanus]|uniref:EGF-like domain-containing protein n=2 Tax=Volvox africanus TaxID=51714 RepID=A0A8J4AVS9_9CHLO|nr:hypothetical protein Vafri_4706 [Volvox africanus]